MQRKIVLIIIIFFIVIINPVSYGQNHLKSDVDYVSTESIFTKANYLYAQSTDETKSEDTNPDKTKSEDTNPEDIKLDEKLPQGKDSSESVTTEEIEPAPVEIDGKELFSIQISIGDIPPEKRAKEIEEKIIKIAEDNTVLPEDLKIINFEGLKFIQAGDIFIVGFGQADAEAANQSLSLLADERLETIKTAIIEYRESRTQESIVRGAITAVISTIAAIIAWILLNRTLPHYFNKFRQWQQQRFRSVRFQGLQFLSSGQINKLISVIFNIIRFFLIALLVYIYIPFILSSFPVTKPYAVKLLRSFWNAINLVWDGIIGYIPNIFIIGLICFIAYYSLRFARIFFNAITLGRIRLQGFYPEWAEPTYKLVTFLIIGFAAVLIFPYLPASDSAGFQGVSLFAGALVTFGSTAVISNIVSGIVLIYTRSFQMGDVIRANGYTGQVVEKTILSTRILTPDNEVITIPNGSLIGSEITNYTAIIRDQKQPLIIKTTITLGYDVPWRKVHQVLVEAAKAGEGILTEPEPFVFQTSLDDYYVAYTIKAYTNEPEKMGFIYSQLHQNIQDKCNEADIEILSPHYRAVRDGHQTTIPEDYLPDDYQAPSFRIDSK